MNIINHGKWVPYIPTPDKRPTDVPAQTLFCKRVDDDVDWYEYIYRLEDAEQPTHYTPEGTPIYASGHERKKIIREAFSMDLPHVRCAALFQPAYNTYIIGPAVYDVSRIFPANMYAFEVTDYVGTDPQGDLGNKAFDPINNTISSAVLVQYTIPRSLIVERINAAGKFNQLKSYLNSHAFESEVWYGTMEVRADNALVLTMLAAIGANACDIMAPPT